MYPDVAAVVDVYGKGKVSVSSTIACMQRLGPGSAWQAMPTSSHLPPASLLFCACSSCSSTRTVRSLEGRIHACMHVDGAGWGWGSTEAAHPAAKGPWPPPLQNKPAADDATKVTLGGVYTQANSILNLVREGLVKGEDIIIVSVHFASLGITQQVVLACVHVGCCCVLGRVPCSRALSRACAHLPAVQIGTRSWAPADSDLEWICRLHGRRMPHP